MFMKVKRKCGHVEYLNLPVDADFIRIETEQKCSSCFFDGIYAEPLPFADMPEFPETEAELPIIPLGLHITAFLRFKVEQLKMLIFS